MRKREQKRYQKHLLAEQERLSTGIRKLEQETLYQPVGDGSTDLTSLAEVGTDSFERETALNIAGGESERLREVAEALERIRTGTFGTCLGCGQDIPKKRLDAFPAARHCIECQSRLERDGTL
jgi:RNA polymerase-binding transcription factor DksA